MAKKTYKSLTGIQYTFPVRVKDKTHWISFTGDQNEYSTSTRDIQQAIESHPGFAGGEIGLAYPGQSKGEAVAVVEPVEYTGVNDLNEAVAVLRAEPYKVNPVRLKSREAVLTIAAELGVAFPNLPADEALKELLQ
jgi:hypothetical protein